MPKFLLLSILLALPAVPQFAAAEAAPAAESADPDKISDKEQKLIADCAGNVGGGADSLSPDKAAACVKGLNAGDPPLITRYSKDDPEAAGSMIGKNNALVDLKRIVVQQDGFSGAQALSRVLEDGTLTDLGLGPNPEKFFDWVGKYAPDRMDAVKSAVRTWDSLDGVAMKSLAGKDYGLGKDSWNKMDILERYSMLSSWAQQETDKLVQAAAVKGAKDKLDIPGLSSVLRKNLIFSDDAPYRAKLDGLLKPGASSPGAGADKPTAADGKSKELAAAGGKLASLSPDAKGDYLARAFDNKMASAKPAPLTLGGKPGSLLGGKPGATGTVPAKPATPGKMTAEQEKALGESLISMKDGKPAGHLVDVLNQTEAGKRTVDFYKAPPALGDKPAADESNKLNFGFKREPGVFGYWDPSTREIKINSEVAEEFAAKKGMTVDEMMKDKTAMRDLALYISPTFVHESEHQNQTSRAIKAGIDYIKFPGGNSTDPYTRAKENLSNKWSAEHMIEYCSKNGGAGCFQNFHSMHADNADKYMQGGLAALDKLKAPLYPRINSLEGGAASEFRQAQTYASQLKALESKYRTAPDSLSADEKQKMDSFRGIMDTRFKWYTMIYDESVDAEADALAFRKKYGGAKPAFSILWF